MRFTSAIPKMAIAAVAAATMPIVTAAPSGAITQPDGAVRSEASQNRDLGMDLVQEVGWSYRQFQCLDKLWIRESGWNHLARNRDSGAYGIPQSLPADKMNQAGSDWRENPETQIWWGLNYIHNRYHTPCGAWRHSQNTGWY